MYGKYFDADPLSAETAPPTFVSIKNGQVGEWIRWMGAKYVDFSQGWLIPLFHLPEAMSVWTIGSGVIRSCTHSIWYMIRYVRTFNINDAVSDVVYKLEVVKKNGLFGVKKYTLLSLGGATVHNRSTFGVTLKTCGYNASNELCGRSVASN